MYNETTNVTQNETINSVTGIEKATGIFYKVQTVCCFTSLLSLLGAIFFMLGENSILLNASWICLLLGMISMIIAAPIRIIKVWISLIIGVAKFCVAIPVIPVNFILALFFGGLTIGVGFFGVVIFGGVITMKKYFEEMR